MANTEILAAIKEFQSTIEGQILATNATLKEFMSSFDSRFADLLSIPPSPSPATAFSPLFRSGGGSSVPQQRCLPNAPLQPPGSAAPPPKPTPEPTAILTALLEKAGCKTSDSLSTFAPNDEASKDIDSPDLCKLSNAEVVPFLSFDVTSAAVSTSFSAAPPPSTSPAPPPSAVVSPPSPPSSAASKTVEVSISRSPAAAMSAESLSICGVLSETKRIINAPSPAPLPPTRDVTPPPIFQFGPQPPPSPPQAHITWFSPLDMEAQSNPFNKFQDDVAVASRRGVIFSLYALEEVYKDIFESPP